MRCNIPVVKIPIGWIDPISGLTEMVRSVVIYFLFNLHVYCILFLNQKKYAVNAQTTQWPSAVNELDFFWPMSQWHGPMRVLSIRAVTPPVELSSVNLADWFPEGPFFLCLCF